MTVDLRELRVALVSTFPPTRCGVAKYSHDLCRSWRVFAPGLDVRVSRVVTTSDVMVPDDLVDAVFDPASPTAVRSVTHALNCADVAMIHHEYGIYGPRHGEAVMDLAKGVRIPLVSVLHTVLSRPSVAQRHIVEELGRNGKLLVFTESARRCLLDQYEVEARGVGVVRRGTSWTPAPPRPGPRRQLISWGLLGPGKGIERALEALSLVDLDPPATYAVVGQTHPRVRERYGERYRHSLEDLTRALGLESRVRFVDRFLSDAELRWMVSNADVAVIPHDDPDLTCCGTLVEPLALGRPAVATAFPHAMELLGDGAGRAVERTPEALAGAIVSLLEDETAYTEAACRAASWASEHGWDLVCSAYAETLSQARTGVGVE